MRHHRILWLLLLCLLWLPVQAQQPPTLVVGEDDALGVYLVAGATNQPVYTFTLDSPEEIACVGDCLGAWLPLTIEAATMPMAADGIVGELDVVERTDTGTLQVTYNRQPLYTFAADTGGVPTGDGAGSLWFVARPQLVGLGGNQELGQFLTDRNGRTLYTSFNDLDGTSQCTAGCATNWPPLTVNNEDELYAGFGALANSDLDTIMRDDLGVLQVRYQGRPLYTFAADTAPDLANGNGVNDVWFVARPPIMQIVENETFGQIWVGNDGTTLYSLLNDTAETDPQCVGDCAMTWIPHTVVLDSDLDGVRAAFGDGFGTSPRADGTLQVTRQGNRLYYYTGDTMPGDTNGDGLGGVWSVVAIGGAPVSADPAPTMATDTAQSDPAEASSPTEMTPMCSVTAKTNANLRGGPGTVYTRVGSIPANEARSVTGQANGNDGFVWWRLDDDAWIRSDLVTTEGNCDLVPMVDPPPVPTAAPVVNTPVPVAPTCAAPNTPVPVQPPTQAPPQPATTEDP